MIYLSDISFSNLHLLPSSLSIPQPIKGSIALLVDDSNPNKPIYKLIYPSTSADQIKDLKKFLQESLGMAIHSNKAGHTIIDTLHTSTILSLNDRPINANVELSQFSFTAKNDSLSQPLHYYIADISPVFERDDQIEIRTGQQVKNQSPGRILTINYVENAQKDNFSQPIHSYLKHVNQTAPNELEFQTGEDFVNKRQGKRFSINEVPKSYQAFTDDQKQVFSKTYSKLHHKHSSKDLTDLKDTINNAINDTVIKIINDLLVSGQLQDELHALRYQQIEKKFNENDTITLTYNRSSDYCHHLEILKFNVNNEETSSLSFTFNNPIFLTKFINEDFSFLSSSSLSFSKPKPLNEGWISHSGIITLNDLSKIQNIEI